MAFGQLSVDTKYDFKGEFSLRTLSIEGSNANHFFANHGFSVA